MYSVDQEDRVVALGEVPKPGVGAPCPVILADESTLVLAYYVSSPPPPDWDGIPREISLDSTGESAALVTFYWCWVHIQSEITDATINGHPLYDRGLNSYSAFEVLHSSWIRQLEHFQATEASPQPQRYARLRHFIFAFHDSLFECVASSLDVELHQASIRSLVPRMTLLLSQRCAINTD
jgi:hypothetical protein